MRAAAVVVAELLVGLTLAALLLACGEPHRTPRHRRWPKKYASMPELPIQDLEDLDYTTIGRRTLLRVRFGPTIIPDHGLGTPLRPMFHPYLYNGLLQKRLRTDPACRDCEVFRLRDLHLDEQVIYVRGTTRGTDNPDVIPSLAVLIDLEYPVERYGIEMEITAARFLFDRPDGSRRSGVFRYECPDGEPEDYDPSCLQFTEHPADPFW